MYQDKVQETSARTPPVLCSVPCLSFCSSGRRWNSCEVTKSGPVRAPATARGTNGGNNFSNPAFSIPWGMWHQAATNLKSASSMTTNQKLDVPWHSETVTYHGKVHLWTRLKQRLLKKRSEGIEWGKISNDQGKGRILKICWLNRKQCQCWTRSYKYLHLKPTLWAQIQPP